MKLPDPTPEELMAKFMAQVPETHKTSTDTAITTPGAIATVIIAGVVFNAISPWWLVLAVPLAMVAFNAEIKSWRTSRGIS